MNKYELKQWLIEKVSEESGLDISAVNVNAPFESFELDSLSMITISFDLENVLGIEIDPTLFLQNNSIELLSEEIEKRFL